MNRCGAILLFLILVAGQAHGQVDVGSGPYAMTGLFAVPHSPLEQEFEIQLMNDAETAVARLRKHSQEQFRFDGLAGGTYFLHVSVSGYKTVLQRVELGGGQREINAPIILEAEPEILRPKHINLSGENDEAVSVSEISQPSGILKDYEEAGKKLQAGNIDDARRRLESIVRQAPHFYAAHQSLATVYQEEHRYADAVKEYQTARQLEPLSAAPLIGLASLCLQQIDGGVTKSMPVQAMLNETKQILQRATQLNPQAAFAHYLLGVTHYKLSADTEAENSLTRALELEPRLGSARLALANVYIRAQDWQRALTQLDAYIKENPRALDHDQILERRSRIERISRTSRAASGNS